MTVHYLANKLLTFILNMSKQIYENLLCKYLRYYPFYNCILNISMLVICNLLFQTGTANCMMVESELGVPPLDISNSSRPTSLAVELLDHYQTYEKFKEYMNLNIIKNSELIHNIEPLSVTYIRGFLYAIEGLLYINDVPYSKNLDDLYYSNIMAYISHLLYNEYRQVTDISTHNNIILNLAQLNTELKNPLLQAIIQLQLFFDNTYDRTEQRFSVDTLLQVEKALNFYSTGIRTQEFMNPLLNEYLKTPVSEFSIISSNLPESNNPFKLFETTNMDELARHFWKDVERDVRLTSYALNNATYLSDTLLKMIIFNKILYNQTDYAFWTQYLTMSDTDADNFIFNINIILFFEQQAKYHRDENMFTDQIFSILIEIFTELSEYNTKHNTNLTMGQIISILSSRL